MTLVRITLPFLLLFLLQDCGKKPALPPLNAEALPANALSINAEISDLNCWVEQGQFFITGVCSNRSASWQKIWLEAAPVDAAGKPVEIKGHGAVIVPTFSDAVPPQGRTAFFAFWPVGDFSAPPVSCHVKAAGALTQSAGPILLVEDINGLKMLKPLAEGLPATEETAWQISGTLHNPLPLVANNPRLELLLYDTDKRLWLCTLLNPNDPQTRQLLHLEHEGPLQPGEKRSFGLQVAYDRLPKALKEKKIGRVDVLAFEAHGS